jgi:hypothetical protein
MWVGFLFAAGLIRAEPPALLASAVGKYSADAERWAYTQTSINRGRDGKVDKELAVRFDPSQPFDLQWTPLSIDGKPATEHQIAKYRADQEKRRKERPALGELLDLNRATAVEETPQTITYEVPLIKTGNLRLPPEKFRVTAVVDKASGTLDSVAVRLREALRVKLIFKLKSGEADIRFATVDPKFAPTIASLRAEGSGSVFFVKLGGNYAATRADFRRVKPYSERLQVKLAPLQFLDY